MNVYELMTLDSIKGVGNKSLKNIVNFMDEEKLDTILQLDDSSSSKLQDRIKNIFPKLQNFLANDCPKDIFDQFERKYTDLEKSGVTVVGYCEDRYPRKLTELDDPPALLYCKGDISLLNFPESVAIVGTRKNSKRGAAITKRTVEFLSNEEFVTVSGLALGIDGIAHRAALDAGGKTIAVLVDIEKIMPSSHIPLAAEILQAGGLLVSENSPNTPAFPALFVKRDRIQAGLSLAVFAIETSEDGGTMHAVKSAQNLGRSVYVPDARAAGYTDLAAKEITGTQCLIESSGAEAYTKENYAEIAHALKVKGAALALKVDGI